MKIFTLSGAFSYRAFILRLLKYFELNPDALRADTRVGSVFGSVNNLIWSGGRLELIDRLPLESIRKTFAFYNSFGVGVNLTMTNPLLEPQHLEDIECNAVMAVLNENPLNGVIVNSDMLRDYLARTYPNLRLILSCTHCVQDVAYHKEREDRYDLLVLPPDVAKRPERVRAFGDLSKYELLVNEKCIPDCPVRRKHYESIGRSMLTANWETYDCARKRAPEQSGGLVLNQSEIEAYHAMGISHFKVAGRVEVQGLFQTLYEYIHYLVNDDRFMDVHMYVMTPFIVETMNEYDAQTQRV